MKANKMIENLVFGMDMVRADESTFRNEADAFLKEAEDRYSMMFGDGKYTAEDGNHIMRWASTGEKPVVVVAKVEAKPIPAVEAAPVVTVPWVEAVEPVTTK